MLNAGLLLVPTSTQYNSFVSACSFHGVSIGDCLLIKRNILLMEPLIALERAISCLY